MSKIETKQITLVSPNGLVEKNLTLGNDGILVLDAQLQTSNLSALELSYLDGVTSNIQTQLGTKAPLIDALLTGKIGLNSWSTLQRTFTGSGGTAIFESASIFGTNIPTLGLLIVSEINSNKYWVGMLKKDNDAEAVQHFAIVAYGLSVLATNNSGTVAMQGFTNTSNVIMKSFIIRAS